MVGPDPDMESWTMATVETDIAAEPRVSVPPDDTPTGVAPNDASNRRSGVISRLSVSWLSVWWSWPFS